MFVGIPSLFYSIAIALCMLAGSTSDPATSHQTHPPETETPPLVVSDHDRPYHRLQGVVFDKDSEEAVTGAHVMVARTRQGTSTNAEGYFELRLPAGQHTISVSAVGFETRQVRIQIPRDAASLLSVALDATFVEMDHIYVLGDYSFPVVDTTITREFISLAPAISHVGSLEIERQGAVTITDALKYIPGGLTETRGRKTKQFFSFRGQRYPYPDYAIDGVWQREFDETHYFFSALDIESIEVIRSSNALVKGLSGLSGLIDIRTHKPQRETISVSARYGQHNRHTTHVRYGNKIHDVSFNVSTSLFGTGGLPERRGKERIANVHGTMDWAISPRLHLCAGSTYIYGQRDFVQIVEPGSPNLLNVEESFDPIHTFLTFAKLQYTWNSRSLTELQTNMAYRDATFRRFNVAEQVASSHQEEDYEYGLHLLHRYSPIPPVTLRFGALYNHWLAPQGKRYYAGRRTNVHTWSGVVTGEYRAGDFIFDAGVRLIDGHIVEFGGFGIEGSAAGLQHVAPIRNQSAPTEWQSVLGATWLVSGPVSLHYNLAGGTIAPRRGSITMEGTRPENELRMQHDLGLVFRALGHTELSASVFYTQRRNALGLSGETLTTEHDVLMELYENQDRRSYGIEVSARRGLPLLHSFLSANATLMESQKHAGGSMVGDNELPNLIVNLGFLFNHAGFDANLFVHHTGPYKNNRFVNRDWISRHGDYALGDFYSVDITAGYTFGSNYAARVFAEIKNVLDEPFETVAAYPDPGRLLQAGFRVDL